MAVDEELAAMVMAEPKECCRWVMICCLCCSNVTVVGISIFMLSNFDDDLDLVFLTKFVLLLMGCGLCIVCVILLVERMNDNPEGERFVDTLLSLQLNSHYFINLYRSMFNLDHAKRRSTST